MIKCVGLNQVSLMDYIIAAVSVPGYKLAFQETLAEPQHTHIAKLQIEYGRCQNLIQPVTLTLSAYKQPGVNHIPK